MRKWLAALAGLFVVLLLIGACGSDSEDGSEGQAAREGTPTQEPAGDPERADGEDEQARAERARAEARAEARAAKRAARERRQARERRVRARARRARARREREREAAAAAAVLEVEREADERAAAEAASECDPNYEGACLDPNSADYDCEGGEGDGPDYTGTVRVVGDDVHDLDRDGDRTACDP